MQDKYYLDIPQGGSKSLYILIYCFNSKQSALKHDHDYE
jgi:hypothetical protein